ncbi:MAG TPA: hypothetical protein VHM28_07720 [Anaerolineales bacterium]|jgi:heme/copper-type cytochrome/quinol oxidase subunit 4|nr:hypothetical protein [Anaerolineales bacterium]
MRPWSLILIGFILSVTGVVLPFLMVIHVLPSTYFLNFFAYGCGIAGLFMGIVGASRYVGEHRK